MKKFFLNISLSLTLAIFLSIPITFAESINSFHSDIHILPNSALLITETIQYDFGNEQRHGIYRDIPETFNGNTSILSVTDEEGNSLTHRINHNFKNISVKIGDADITIAGKHTYKISYEVEREISFFDEHDELYWNVTGTDWGINIENASADITFPFTLQEKNASATCFTGFYGETSSNCNFQIDYQQNQTVFSFNTTAQLNGNGQINENLTVVTMFPKGYLAMPSFWDRYKNFILLIFVLFGLCFIPYYVWRKSGDDPDPQTPIVAQYSPPDNLSAGEMALLLKGNFPKEVITATIFELGVKGFLEIQNNDDLTFIKKKEPTEQDHLTQLQSFVFNKIFKNNKTEVKSKDLKYSLANFWTKKTPLLKKLQQKGYFDILPISGPSVLLIAIAGIEIMIAIICFNIGSILIGICFVISLLVTGIFARFMGKKTIKGVETVQAIKGFKLYLEVAEKDRLSFHNPPNKTITLFEQLLPFAVVLGVEKKWSKSFADLLAQTSSNLTYLHTDLNNYTGFEAFNKSLSSISAATHIATSYPSSSGSGHSGSGGGGFSGGGGGGGGGGSW